MMAGKRILLIIGGGIAAYKSLELIRRLAERDVAVKVILTRAGAQFVTPLAVASLSRSKVHDDLFSLTDEAEMGFTYDMLEAFITKGVSAVPREVATRIDQLRSTSDHKRAMPPSPAHE